MANFNLTITNEGAAFLADVIGNQGTLNFTELRFSSTNYVGAEATITAGTFSGTFITVAPSASILDLTTINLAASFDNTTFTVDTQLYSIGIIAEDGNNTEYLVAVCTTSAPDTIPAYRAPASYYSFNINMAVSSTNNITVTGSVAGVLYVSDIVDDLNSYENNKPLSANQGRVLKEMIQAGGLLPHIIITTDTGATITLSKDGTTITATETSTGVYEADVDDYGAWTLTAIKGGSTVIETISVDVVKVYNISISFYAATITVNYPDNMRGQVFTCESGGVTLTETAPNNANTFNFYVPTIGTWTVTGAYAKPVTITNVGDTESVTFYALKTFATATDQEIADMVIEADLGYIDLADDCGWAVGQEHNISLDAIAASGTYDGVSWSVGESQSAQTVTLVLMHKGLYELVTPVLNKQGESRNTCSFIAGMKDCLSTLGYMNSTATNVGSWNGCARRTWCNYGFRNALPPALRAAFKQFKCITGDYDGTASGGTNITSQDYFSLTAISEIDPTADTDTTNEKSAVTQFDYYSTSANRIKNLGSNGVATIYYSRSPYRAINQHFCVVRANGTVNNAVVEANTVEGISPFGCL